MSRRNIVKRAKILGKRNGCYAGSSRCARVKGCLAYFVHKNLANYYYSLRGYYGQRSC